jgi:hypothetical protein
MIQPAQAQAVCKLLSPSIAYKGQREHIAPAATNMAFLRTTMAAALLIAAADIACVAAEDDVPKCLEIYTAGTCGSWAMGKLYNGP